MMIRMVTKRDDRFFVDFVWEKDPHIRSYRLGLEEAFEGEYLQSMYVPLNGQAAVLMGCGREDELGLLQVKEIAAAAAAACKKYKLRQCSLNLFRFVEKLGKSAVIQAVLGLGLGCYTFGCREKEEEKWDCDFGLEGIDSLGDAAGLVEEGNELCSNIIFARNMVNMPGNMLRPMEFERIIAKYMEDVDVEVQTLVYGQLRAKKMEALYSVGGSSEYPPCLVVLRYKGDPGSGEVYGLVGKGVTCDTGGYCLKDGKSMGGIKGDMAGAAAVAGALHAAAKRKLKVNVTACLPLCENRISPSALLPGDVITGYSGRKIEVLNTDAEGRLILSDAVSYAVRDEKVTRVLDIATLTGAVCIMLGHTVAGAMSDDDAFYSLFESGLGEAGERYLRLPYGREHEKMIKSEVADIKNVGGDCCGTITAGLFIREFCEGKPWIHLDIAGTAWNARPDYAFESVGATGAGVTGIYYMLKNAAGEKQKG